jgi:hypothetical protein
MTISSSQRRAARVPQSVGIYGENLTIFRSAFSRHVDRYPGEDAIIRKEGERLIIEPAPPQSLLALLDPLTPVLGALGILPFEVPADTAYGVVPRRLRSGANSR